MALVIQRASALNKYPTSSSPTQVVVWLIMYAEALVVLLNQKSHFRVMRCLRPIFFIDTYIMFGVRR